MIDQWLQYSERVPKVFGNFRLIDVSEVKTPTSEIKDFLADKLLSSYRNLEFLKTDYKHEPPAKLEAYINAYVFPADVGLANTIVKPGDFGEVLASIIVSYFEGLEVPIHKMRWKFNKDRSVFCTDMIAHNPEETITDIHYYEIKTRQNIQKETVNHSRNHVTVNAHNSLLKDQTSGNEGIADFLSRYYHEIGDPDNAKKYSDIVRNPARYTRHFELFFIIEASEYLPVILNDLENLPPSLNPLNVTVVLLNDFRVRVDESYQRAMAMAHKYVYNT